MVVHVHRSLAIPKINGQFLAGSGVASPLLVFASRDLPGSAFPRPHLPICTSPVPFAAGLQFAVMPFIFQSCLFFLHTMNCALCFAVSPPQIACSTPTSDCESCALPHVRIATWNCNFQYSGSMPHCSAAVIPWSELGCQVFQLEIHGPLLPVSPPRHPFPSIIFFLCTAHTAPQFHIGHNFAVFCDPFISSIFSALFWGYLGPFISSDVICDV